MQSRSFEEGADGDWRRCPAWPTSWFRWLPFFTLYYCHRTRDLALENRGSGRWVYWALVKCLFSSPFPPMLRHSSSFDVRRCLQGVQDSRRFHHCSERLVGSGKLNTGSGLTHSYLAGQCSTTRLPTLTHWNSIPTGLSVRMDRLLPIQWKWVSVSDDGICCLCCLWIWMSIPTFLCRICPGRHFAFDTTWIALASIIATFDIGKAIDENGKDIEVSQECASILVPHRFDVWRLIIGTALRLISSSVRWSLDQRKLRH